MKYSDFPERVHDAKLKAQLDAINLLYYKKYPENPATLVQG